MDLSPSDWERLKALRSVFLDGTEVASDYWSDERLLQIYDQTFGQRILWKWQAVLKELEDRGWKPDTNTAVTDWGCGTGIAAQAFAERWPNHRFSFWDRSPKARLFAQKKLAAMAESAIVAEEEKFSGIVLLSHVLGELSDRWLFALLTRLQTAETIFWIEPGTKVLGQKLVDIRETLRRDFQALAPCPHQTVCGLKTPGHENDWCHHFAPPPPFVFRERHWSQFNKFLKIDLRSLPLSYLVLQKKPGPSVPSCRMIGRPKEEKAAVSWQECSEAEITPRRLLKKEAPSTFRQLTKKPPFAFTYESIKALVTAGAAPGAD